MPTGFTYPLYTRGTCQNASALSRSRVESGECLFRLLFIWVLRFSHSEFVFSFRSMCLHAPGFRFCRHHYLKWKGPSPALLHRWRLLDTASVGLQKAKKRKYRSWCEFKRHALTRPLPRRSGKKIGIFYYSDEH